MRSKTQKRLRPTDGELEILAVLWDQGPSTVKEIHEQLEKRRPMGRTTVLKLVQIMTDKGLVRREDSERPSRFRASSDQEATRSHLVEDLLTKAFGGSAETLVMHVLSGKTTDPQELAAIKELLARLEAER